MPDDKDDKVDTASSKELAVHELQLHPYAPGFKDRIDPKPVDPNKIALLKCPRVIKKGDDPGLTEPKDQTCGSIHFRHAGYVEHLLPYMKPGPESKVALESMPVKICVKCKSAFIWVIDQLYEITDQIDMKAWEKTEIEMHQATGPGGQC